MGMPLVMLLLVTTAAAAAPDSLQARRSALLDDLEMLMEPAEEEALRDLETSWQLDAWIEEFWAGRDRSPATPRNERREEHYRRLARARERFPAPERPGFDLRGRDYVLFGPPDEERERDVSVGVFYHPRRIAWIWRDPDMMAEYWDFDRDGVFTRALADPAGTNLARQGARHLGARHFESPFFTDPFDDLIVLDRKGEHAAAVDGRRERYEEPLGLEPLPSWRQVNCFRGDDGAARVEFPWMLPLAELVFAELEDGGPRAARLRESLVVLDGARVAAEGSRELLVPEPASRRRESEKAVGLAACELPPGDYWAVLRLEDRHSGRRSEAGRRRFRVPDFSRPDLALSDLAFASAIVESDLPRRFSRGEWRVTPHPSRRYRRGEPLQVYVEIYGLAVGDDGRHHLRVSTWILPAARSERGDAAWAGTGQSQRDRGDWLRLPLIIGTGSLSPGAWRLEIDVEDALAGTSAARSAEFVVE